MHKRMLNNFNCTYSRDNGFIKRSETNKSYLVVDQMMKWSDGEIFCNSFSAHLPIVRNHLDKYFLRGLVKSKLNFKSINGYWLGLYRLSGSNEFKWIDNSSVTFVDWDVYHPISKSRVDYFIQDRYSHVSSKFLGWSENKRSARSVVICELEC